MELNDKIRPLLLLRILQAQTDEDHFLSTPQLCEILKNDFGIETFRTTIKSDIDILIRTGFNIQITRSKQNLYNYIDRGYDVPEVKLLIDAVMSSKFITKAKSDRLAEKLAKLAGPFKASDLQRNLVVDGRVKQENEQIYLIVDAINEAINNKVKIQFQKIEYNEKKERVLHHNGEEYTFSPYSLVWDGDYYYVIGYSDKYQCLGSHRVDRIFHRPELLDDPIIPPPDGFDINQYINTMFRMYNAPRYEVELLVDNSLMDAIVDKFGTDVATYPYDLNCFRVIATISTGSSFFNWIFGFRGKVKLLRPQEVKQEYENMVREAAEALHIF